MQSDFMFTSEAVTAGHPDKLCDQISDAIVGRYLKQDPGARLSAECAVSTSIAFVSVKASSDATVNVAEVSRGVIRDVGYTHPHGFNDSSCAVMTSIHEFPSPKLRFSEEQCESLVSEDQATVFGFACTHAPELMPLPIWLSRKLTRRMDEIRKRNIVDYVAPDGKAQVGVEFRNRKPSRIHSVTLLCSHRKEVEVERLRQEVRELTLDHVFEDEEIRPDNNTRVSVNPEGSFLDGGPEHHAGLTGRKSGADTYGEFGRNSNAALSGKDPMRAERLGAYAARYAAKNVIAAGLAELCEIQLSYAIGLAEPVSLQAETYGTGRIAEGEIARRLRSAIDFRVGPLLKRFHLAYAKSFHADSYRELAAWGHVGRPELSLPWEATDKCDALK